MQEIRYSSRYVLHSFLSSSLYTSVYYSIWKGSWRWGGIVANEQRLHFRVIFCFLQSKGAGPALIAHI